MFASETQMERLSKIDRLLLDTVEGMADPAQRAMYLDHVCKDDAEERARLESLLEARKSSERFFDFEPLVTCDDEESDERETIDQTAAAGEKREEVGLRIGRYRLIRRLGEGGGGVVYLAEQETPVKRQVALKLIRVGLGHEEVIAQFETERQSLAMMDHPGIARVLDAGTAANGHPFFVMQWVDGERITDFCDKQRLTIPQRLELFIKVCQAVQHAHQKGVIHRDLKPSNVLTALYDGVAQPKVIDFGIAKATGNSELCQSLEAEHEPVIGTPNYMSPEQGLRGGLDVDTRSDIFSLGVMLCELLTGMTPFGPDETERMNTVELRHCLAERQPTAPSVIVQGYSDAELNAVAEMRSCKPGQLARSIEGDLDAIVMKCLERDRQNRYGTASGLALDVQRFLDQEPVVARRESRGSQLRKLVRRNKVSFLAGGIVLVALAAGFGTSTWLFLRESRARRYQSVLREEAEKARKVEAGLRMQAEAREACAHAAVLVSYDRLKEADAILRDAPFSSIPPSMEAANVLRSLGGWHAVHGRWPEAVEYYTSLIRANELSNPDTMFKMSDIVASGAVFAECGNADQYRRFREWVLDRFDSDTGPMIAEQTLQATLLLSADEEFLRRVEPLRAKIEKTEFRKSRLGPGWGAVAAAWRAWSLALLEFRLGNWGRSLEWSQLAIELERPHRMVTVSSHPLRAMCHYRRGDLDAAAKELELARELVNAVFTPEMPASLEPMGNGEGMWWDWIQGRILFHEANAMIEGGVNH